MKINFLLLAVLIITISSCSTAYKTTQTPDDVYYSPLHLQYDSVKTDRNKYSERDNTVYENSEDREMRRRVHNRRYRRYDDGYDYPYGSSYPYGGNYPYGNNYPVYRNPKYGTSANAQQPRKTNLGAYKPNTGTQDSAVIFNPKMGSQNTGATTSPVRTFDKPARSTNGSAVGNFIRKFTSPENNSENIYRPDNSNNSSPSRTFERSNNNNNSNNNSNNSSNNSSTNSSSSGSSTSAPVRTFKKDN